MHYTSEQRKRFWHPIVYPHNTFGIMYCAEIALNTFLAKPIFCCIYTTKDVYELYVIKLDSTYTEDTQLMIRTLSTGY